MNDSLRADIEAIIEMDDPEKQRSSAARVAVYLLELPLPHGDVDPLLLRFVEKIFKILPSSHLPRQLKAKLGGIYIKKERRVSFCGTSVHRLPDTLSLEGLTQQQREKDTRTLSISNLDPQRSFPPRQLLTQGKACNTIAVGLRLADLCNSFRSEPKGAPFAFPVPRINLDAILADPGLLREFK